MGGKQQDEQENVDPEAEQAAAGLEARAEAAAGEEAAEGEYQPGSGEAEQADPSSAEVVQTLAAVTFNLVAVRRGEHWNLSAEEARQIGEAGGAVMDKWAPGMKVGPEATLAVTLGVVAMGRLQQDKAIADAKRREQKEAEAKEAREAEAGAEA